MDSLLKSIPGKVNDSKINHKVNQASKIATGGQTHFRQKRVFGTTRNTNIPAKSVTEKTIAKTKIVVQQRQPKSMRAIQVPNDTNTNTQGNDKKSPENVNQKLNKKSDTSFPQQEEEKSTENSKDKDSTEPKTPVPSPRERAKSKAASTPFYSAVHCSKCRFDRLETSSYWIGQIKMAESVEKHFVSSAFFNLAFESQAEPIRNLRMELRKYLTRHGYLSERDEWRQVAAKYGLLKVESNITTQINSTT